MVFLYKGDIVEDGIFCIYVDIGNCVNIIKIFNVIIILCWFVNWYIGILL